QLFLQLAPQLHVFVQQVSVVAVGIPARLPRLVVIKSKSVRVRLLSHSVLFCAASVPIRSLASRLAPEAIYFLPFFDGAGLPVNALRTRRAVPRTPFCASASASIAATRS